MNDDPSKSTQSDSSKQKSLTQRTLSGFVWMFSGSMAGAILQLIVTMMLARLLTPADFGLLSAALVIIYFSEIFSSLGMGPALVQRQIISQRHINTSFTVNITFSTFLGLLIYQISPAIANFFHMPELVRILQILAILFPIRGFAVLSVSLLKREGQFRKLATANFVSFTLGYGCVGVLLAWLDFGVWALVAATIGQAFVHSILLFIYAPHKIFPQFQYSAFKDLISFGGGVTIANIANYFARNGDNFIVGRWLGAEALGYYSKAFSLMTLPTKQFTKVMEEVLFPTFSRIQNNPKKMTIAYKRGLSAIALVIFPLSAFVSVLAPELVNFFYGPGWEPVVLPFQILCMSMFFRSGYKLSASVQKARGDVRGLVTIQIIYGSLVVLGAFGFKDWGLPGIALSSAFAIFVTYLLFARASLKLIGMKWNEFYKIHIPGIALGAVFGLETYIVSMWLRILDLPPLIIVIVNLLFAGLTFVIIFSFSPRFLGDSTTWILQQLRQILAKKFPIVRPPSGL